MKVYICDACGKECVSDIEEAEAVAEYERDYGKLKPNEVAIICDDCYKVLEKIKEQKK